MVHCMSVPGKSSHFTAQRRHERRHCLQGAVHQGLLLLPLTLLLYGHVHHPATLSYPQNTSLALAASTGR